MTGPGSADAALTVGAVDSSDTMAWFSSRGPRLRDGAVKPDVVAPGVGIVAARAAGTSLGVPVDDFYTSLEGTSMATPHVAGVAAIVKHAHPTWDGERIKAAITGTAAAVEGATAFDAGTGRVDAERAIAAPVLSSPSLNLGFYPYPQSGLPVTHTPVTYTNPGEEPLELELSLGSQNGDGIPPAGVSLSATQLAVPAGGTAQVDVVFDPGAVGATGPFSGVVTAETASGATVRTAFGFELESEHYDLTVAIEPRPGTQHSSHVIGLVDLATGGYDQAELEGSGRQTHTFRVPPGTYSVGDISFGLAADEASEGTLAYEPSLSVTADTELVLDHAKTAPFDYSTQRPVVSEGQIMMVDSYGAAGYSGFVFAGAVDRLYAQPLDSSDGGTVDSALNWLLSQPDAEIATPRGANVPLRAVGAPRPVHERCAGAGRGRPPPDRRRRQHGRPRHVGRGGRDRRRRGRLRRARRGRRRAARGRRRGDGGLRGRRRKLRRHAGDALGAAGLPDAAVPGCRAARSRRRAGARPLASHAAVLLRPRRRRGTARSRPGPRWTAATTPSAA